MYSRLPDELRQPAAPPKINAQSATIKHFFMPES